MIGDTYKHIPESIFLNTKTKPEYAGQLLSYKLRYFLNKHLGVAILLGNIHSIATEKVLPKVTHLFDLKLVNVKTGETVDWSNDNYNQLTSTHSITDWQVLMVGNPQPFNEDVDRVVSYCSEHVPVIKPVAPEATYMIWLDCRQMGMSGKDLHRFFIEKAGVGMNEGSLFGPGGEGFMRMNVACPGSVVEKALKQIERAING